VPDATTPAGSSRVVYFRLHGSPRTYWSRYDENAITSKDMPYLHWMSLVALPANFMSAALLWRGRRDIAFTLLLPFMIVIAPMAILWIRDFSVFRGLRI
jgi:hypothetical protein